MSAIDLLPPVDLSWLYKSFSLLFLSNFYHIHSLFNHTRVFYKEEKAAAAAAAAAAAMDKKCPRMLDFNAPLISTRRPTGVVLRRSISQGASRDISSRVPFSWEQTPGKPKDTDACSDSHDTVVLPPKPPPGRWHPPKEAVRHDSGCDGDADDDYDSFSDAVDMFSLSEAIDVFESVEAFPGVNLGTCGSESPSFIIQRFLPDALAASSAVAVSRNVNMKLAQSKDCSEKCVPRAIGRAYSTPKGCGLDIFFPWRMKHKPCGVKSPVRASSLSVKPQWSTGKRP
ncbi:hypothetical protein RJ639_023801 [Escallonia herrerae]|uniref:Uncharacterized protein n=1 Tax=Escallonia herrerae TaxID=1293975 RepID=A0AA89AF13_9ASTE|nr:hypothetical protein RJ639_023801 [Escallonia herrerae]